MSGLMARLCPNFWQHALALPAGQLSVHPGCSSLPPSTLSPWALAGGPAACPHPARSIPSTLLPAQGRPTPATRTGCHPCCIACHAPCFAMGVPRPNLGLSHLLMLFMAPSGWNASLCLLLAVFLGNMPVDTHGQSSGDSLFNLGEEPVK